MPEAFAYVSAFVFGAIIGSFLNVVIWRLPRGENLNHPGSHCPTCGHAIRPYDNIPLVSWLVLRGACRDCGSRISIRYPLVELGTALMFVLTLSIVGVTPLLLPMLWFAAVSVALTMIDLDVRRLPNSIVLTSWVAVGMGLVVVALVDQGSPDLVRALLGALAMGGFYLLLNLISAAGMGMGDVKLAVLVGMVLGWFGWAEVVVGGFLGFLLGAVWGVGLMVVRKGGRKTAVPFGPFMIAGTWLALIWGTALADWYVGVLATG